MVIWRLRPPEISIGWAGEYDVTADPDVVPAVGAGAHPATSHRCTKIPEVIVHPMLKPVETPAAEHDDGLRPTRCGLPFGEVNVRRSDTCRNR